MDLYDEMAREIEQLKVRLELAQEDNARLMVLHLPQPLPCPICGARPDIDQCAPWPHDSGPPAWYANCYRMMPEEHCVGVNADSHRQVIEAWNAEVAAVSNKAGKGEANGSES